MRQREYWSESSGELCAANVLVEGQSAVVTGWGASCFLSGTNSDAENRDGRSHPDWARSPRKSGGYAPGDGRYYSGSHFVAQGGKMQPLLDRHGGNTSKH